MLVYSYLIEVILDLVKYFFNLSFTALLEKHLAQKVG